MELKQLNSFIKVAELLNSSAAAKALYITQSTLSQQIQQLEQELDVQLFQRNSHSVSLTESGEELLPLALQTLHCANTCKSRMNDLKALLTGTLNIGATHTFSPILTDTLLNFMKLYPKVKLNIHYKSMEELMNLLEKNKVDLVLAFKPSQEYRGVESHLLFHNHLAAIVNNHHPLASKSTVTLTELEKYDIALPAKGMQARNALEQLIAHYDSPFRVRLELNEVHILLKLIKQSNLVTILSEATIHDEQGIKAIPIEIPGSDMEGCVHLLKNNYHKRSALEFIRLLSDSNAIRNRIRDWLI